MTGEEFLYLSGVNGDGAKEENSKKYAYGMRALGDAIGCSLTTIFLLKKDGILDEAIVSFVGRRIAFDVEKARILADRYKSEQRDLRQINKKSKAKDNAERDKQ